MTKISNNAKLFGVVKMNIEKKKVTNESSDAKWLRKKMAN